MSAVLFRGMFFWDILTVSIVLMFSLPKRPHTALRTIIAVAGCYLSSHIWMLLNPHWAGSLAGMIVDYFGAYLIVLCLMWLVVELDLWTFLYMGTFVWFTQQFANAVDFAFKTNTGASYANWFRHKLILILCALAVYWITTHKFQRSVLRWLRLDRVGPIWLLMCVVCCGLNSYAGMSGQATTAFYLAEMCFNLFGLMYLHNLYALSGLERESQNVHFMLEQGRRQYEISRENIEQINIKTHDLRHQIRDFHQKGQIDEAVLADMEHTIDRYDSVFHTGNEALDIILTEKSLICNSKSIGFTCMAQADGIEHMEAADLYALFGNALENAIEATEKLTDPAKKQISFTMHRVGGFCIAQIQNYTQEAMCFHDGVPQTTKADKRNHGVGVRSMQLLVEKYGGQMNYHQEEDMVELDLIIAADPV